MRPPAELLAPARELLASRLSERSLAHCERVGATARAMALRFGVDAEAAELAGLLHDYERDESPASLLTLAEDLGLTVLPVERESPRLLHARVAAALLRRELPGVGEAVLSAVASHTVGAVPMSDLDRIVYMADMTEPARHYEGVDDLRAACEASPLAECFRQGYARSLRQARISGHTLHPVSGAVSAEIERETGRPLFDPAEASR